MSEEIIHALVLIQNWGNDTEMLKILIRDSHTISLYHIMGKQSFLLDTNFDGREQLSRWIDRLKSSTLPCGVPSIISLQTQRIIDVPKKKEDFTLQKYQSMAEKYHFFVKIDNPHHDEELLDLLKESPMVQSVLHIQGDHSFTIEVIASGYDEYREFLGRMKNLSTIHHIETQEVISVIKYRNAIIDEHSGLVSPEQDFRELYTL